MTDTSKARSGLVNQLKAAIEVFDQDGGKISTTDGSSIEVHNLLAALAALEGPSALPVSENHADYNHTSAVKAWLSAPRGRRSSPMQPVYPDESPRNFGSSQGKKERAKYSSLFGKTSKPDDFENMDTFIHAVKNRSDSPTMQRLSMAGESLGSSGGFSTPTEFSAEWLDSSLEGEIVRGLADVWPMGSDTKRIPLWDCFDQSTGLYGGVTAEWVAEGAESTPQTPKMQSIQLTAHKCILTVEVSNELLADGISYGTQLSRAMTTNLRDKLDFAFLRGDGVAKPLGVLSAPSLVTVTKETGQAAATIVYDNIVKLFARMHPSCIPYSVFVCNPTCIPQLFNLNMGIETAPKFLATMGEKPTDLLLGRPLIYSSQLPVLGTVGDIVMVDFTKYIIGMRQDVAIAATNALGFTRDTTHFRVLTRIAGQPKWSTAVTPKSGNSLSWAVAIATRS